MILNKIIEEKRKEIEKAKESLSLTELIKKSPSFIAQVRGFKEAVSRSGQINLIAEIKKASRSEEHTSELQSR